MKRSFTGNSMHPPAKIARAQCLTMPPSLINAPTPIEPFVQLRQDNEALKRQNDELQKCIKDLKATVNTCKDEIKSIREDVGSTQELLVSARNHQARMQGEVSNLAKPKRAARGGKKKKKELEEAQAREEELARELEGTQQRTEQLEEMLEAQSKENQKWQDLCQNYANLLLSIQQGTQASQPSQTPDVTIPNQQNVAQSTVSNGQTVVPQVSPTDEFLDPLPDFDIDKALEDLNNLNYINEPQIPASNQALQLDGTAAAQPDPNYLPAVNQQKEADQVDFEQWWNTMPVSGFQMQMQPQPDYQQQPQLDYQQQPQFDYQQQPQANYPQQPQSNYPQQPQSNYPQQPQSNYPQQPQSNYPQQLQSNHQVQPQPDYQLQTQPNGQLQSQPGNQNGTGVYSGFPM